MANRFGNPDKEEEARGRLPGNRFGNDEPVPFEAAIPYAPPIKRSRLNGLQAFGSAFGDTASFGFGDEIKGGLAGLGAMASGGDFKKTYDTSTALSRETLKDAWDNHAGAALAGTFAGAFVPGMPAGALVRAGAGVGGRLARAAIAGGAAGGLSGIGAGTDLESRVQGGVVGGVAGSALGAGVQKVGEKLGNAAIRLGKANRSATDAGPTGRVLDDMVLQAQRSGVAQDLEGLSTVFDDAARIDPTMTRAEAIGQAGVKRVIGLTRQPGETADLAARQLGGRNADTFDDLTQRIDDNLTPHGPEGPMTVRSANGELDALFQQTSMHGYEPALRNALPSNVAAGMRSITDRAPRLYQQAEAVARDIARAEGVDALSPTDPRYWHYLKVGADEVLHTMTRQGGLGPSLRRQWTHNVRALRDQLDQVPGYRDARIQWGSLSEAREALEQGFQFDRMLPAQMDDLARGLSPFQERYLQAGITERLRDVLARKDNDGLANIAKAMTGRRTQELLARAFRGRENELQDFLTLARAKRDMHSNASRMMAANNSVTGIVGAEALDMAALTNPKNTLMQGLWNATAGRVGERYRDNLGAAYLAPVGEAGRTGMGLMSSRAAREARMLAAVRRGRRTRSDLRRTREAYQTGIGFAGVYDPTEDD